MDLLSLFCKLFFSEEAAEGEGIVDSGGNSSRHSPRKGDGRWAVDSESHFPLLSNPSQQIPSSPVPAWGSYTNPVCAGILTDKFWSSFHSSVGDSGLYLGMNVASKREHVPHSEASSAVHPGDSFLSLSLCGETRK